MFGLYTLPLFILLLFFSGADCFRAGNQLSYACTGFTKESIDEVMAAIPKAEEDYEEEDEKDDREYSWKIYKK